MPTTLPRTASWTGPSSLPARWRPLRPAPGAAPIASPSRRAATSSARYRRRGGRRPSRPATRRSATRARAWELRATPSPWPPVRTTRGTPSATGSRSLEQVTINICHATGEEELPYLVGGSRDPRGRRSGGRPPRARRRHHPAVHLLRRERRAPRVRRPELGSHGPGDLAARLRPARRRLRPIPSRSPRPPSVSSCWQAGASAPTSGTTTRTA